MKENLNRRKFLSSLVVPAALSIVPFDAFGRMLFDSEIPSPNVEKPFFAEQDLFTAGSGDYHTYRIPSLIVTKKNSLLAFCEGRKGGSSDSGQIDLVYRRSADGGQTWSAQQVLYTDGANTFGNPCPVIDRKTGTIHLITTRNLGADREADIINGTSRSTRTIWHSSSTDDGKTWSSAIDITASVKDPNWTWYATGPGAGIQTKNGRLIIPCDHIEKTTKIGYSHIIYSDDNGKTWHRGGSAPRDTNECEIVELSDGRLLLNMRNYDRNFRNRAISTSTDQGLTWSPIIRDEALIEPICQASIRRYPAKKNGKNLILFSNPASRDKRENMTVRLSEDDAKTWTKQRTLWAGPAAYSCLAVAPNKNIYCLYERGATSSYEKITLAQFNLAWLSEG